MYFLHKLKEYGFQPKSILDVGANKAEWTVFVKPIFPDARFFLIDAIDYEELHDFEHLIAVVSDREKEVDFFQQGWTGDSYYQEDTGHYEYVSPTKRTTTTLDAIFPEDEKFELIKIDCQGAELDILEGAPRLLSQCEVISLEVPFFTQYNKGTENFAGHIAYMEKKGFTPFSINEIIAWEDIAFQLEISFLRKDSEIIEKCQAIVRSWTYANGGT